MRNKKQRMIIDIAEVTLDIRRHQEKLAKATTDKDQARLTEHVEALSELKDNLAREYRSCLRAVKET